jgi:hypothetical protein
VTAHSILMLLRAYTASLWDVPLSQDTWDLLSERSPDTDEFLWTCNLLRLCPAAEKPNRKLAAVHFYYSLLEDFFGAPPAIFRRSSMNGFYASASRAFISLLLSWTSASKKIDSFTRIWLPTVKTPTHNLNVAAVISGPIYPMPVKSAQNQMIS